MINDKDLKRKILKPHRNQIEFFIESLDDRLPDSHMARIVWSFVEELDLSRFDQKVKSFEGDVGRPAIDSRILFSLWLFAYNEGIGSAHKIDRLCQENDAYRWLTGGVSINYHTIADFRTQNENELADLFAQCLAVLMNENLIDPTRVGIDGTKIRAKAKSSRFHRKTKLEQYLAAATEHVKEVDELVQETQGSMNKKLAAKRRLAKERLAKCKKALSTLVEIQAKKKPSEREQARVSITDPEARVMKFGGSSAFSPAYNVQIAVSLGTDVILAIEPTQDHDDSKGILRIMKSVKKNTKQLPRLIVTDEGYSNYISLKYTNRLGVEHYTPPKYENTIHPKQITKFFKDNSKLDVKNNQITCPNGNVFNINQQRKRPGGIEYRCARKINICGKCQHDKNCFPQGRSKRQPTVHMNRKTIYHEFLIKKLKTRLENSEAKTLKALRFSSEIVNARIKGTINLKQFNVQGLQKIRPELLLTGIAHNFTRLVSLRKKAS